MKGWLGRFLRHGNEAELKPLWAIVERVNELETCIQSLSDDELKSRTDEFRDRLGRGATLDDILPQAFATVREVAKRTLGQRPFDVQILGGVVLHQGRIAEMKTGEGKTLAATLPIYLNALAHQGVHVVTVNDYLARRDTQWMGPIFSFLGMSIGCVQHDDSYLFDSSIPEGTKLVTVPRAHAYQADITYGTNSEFGFDFLRDNMSLDLSTCVQRNLGYAIVDEVDYILIDEARTPLIISAPAQQSTQDLYSFAQVARRLVMGVDVEVDEKIQAVTLREPGIAKTERALKVDNLYDAMHSTLSHFVDNALRAEHLYSRDREYVVSDGQVIIVDQFTGRLMQGRRYADGLHQAIEAKEKLTVQRQNTTMATITLQNYFRMYTKLAGMTGTAVTEAEEFAKIYNLAVVPIPSHKVMVRHDEPDIVHKTQDAKFHAIVQEIQARNDQGQPVLVGTVSIEDSERLSTLLKRQKIPHEVLNAKQHEREAAIVAQAGQLRAVTVATNMAGRGTDIVLGAGVADKGGLRIIGTERHDARRIDNQLRGRAGRQGDPGSSCFFISLEDELMRRFGGDRVKALMTRFGLEDEVPIQNAIVTKTVENAQVRVEGYNFEIRKHLVEYDDVVNAQRQIIYGERRKILEGADLKSNLQDMVREEISSLVSICLDDGDAADDWDLEGMINGLTALFPVLPTLAQQEEMIKLSVQEIEQALLDHAEALYDRREQDLGPETMRFLERVVMLRTVDTNWVEHLTAMDNMRQGIGLRAVSQTDPLVVYKREAHGMYQELRERIRQSIVRSIYRANLVGAAGSSTGTEHRPLIEGRDGELHRPLSPVQRDGKTGRNHPCHCGSGKKYKRCHGK